MSVKTTQDPTPFVFKHEELIKRYDHRSLTRRIFDLARSFFLSLDYLIRVTYHSLTMKTPSEDHPKWKEQSHGLILMLHGLNNSPYYWFKQIKLLKKEDNLDIYAPFIRKKGACSLSEAVEPIYETVMSYIRKHPGKPICLLGTSNGARLTTKIETELRKRARFTPVKLSNISGAHFGSSLLNLCNRLGLSYLFIPKIVRDELSHGSDQAKELILGAQKPLPFIHGTREYDFYATTEDLIVPDLNSSLPKIGKRAQFHVVNGQGHDSIVAFVAKEQIDSCLKWISNHQPSIALRLLSPLFTWK